MGPKKEGFWPRINCNQMNLPDFESPSGDGLSKSAISDFQSEFSMSKIICIFLKKFSLRNIHLGAPFLKKTFFADFNFKTTLLLKRRPILDKLSPDGDPKFGNFICLQLILDQKPCNLGPIQLVRRKVNIH